MSIGQSFLNWEQRSSSVVWRDLLIIEYGCRGAVGKHLQPVWLATLTGTNSGTDVKGTDISKSCLETYEVLVFIQMRLSSLQQPPQRNTLTQGGLKNVSVLFPSSLATSTHVSRGLHWVLCHSSSMTTEKKLLAAHTPNGPYRPSCARVRLNSHVPVSTACLFY